MSRMFPHHTDNRDHEKPLTWADCKALRRAIDEMNNIRGLYSGNPDPEPLKEFDATIKRARLALRKVRELKRQGK